MTSPLLRHERDGYLSGLVVGLTIGRMMSTDAAAELEAEVLALIAQGYDTTADDIRPGVEADAVAVMTVLLMVKRVNNS